MQNPVPDERYYVANEAILGAFFKLSREKAPDKITVSDIIKAAGIARSTFYNHYQDIPSLVAAVEEKTICDVFSMMEKFHPKNDLDICRSYFLSICQYTIENPFLASLLSTPHGNDLFEKMLTMLHHYVTDATSNSSPNEHTKEEISYVITCAIGSTIGASHFVSHAESLFCYARGSSIRASCLLIFFVVLRIKGFFRTINPVI